MTEFREICLQGCSAKTGDGIWEGIGKLQEVLDTCEKKSNTLSESVTN